MRSQPGKIRERGEGERVIEQKVIEHVGLLVCFLFSSSQEATYPASFDDRQGL